MSVKNEGFLHLEFSMISSLNDSYRTIISVYGCDPLQEEGSKNISKIQYDLLETNDSKIAFIISLLKPTQLEYSLIKLPKYLNFVYYVIRPFNVIFRKIN